MKILIVSYWFPLPAENGSQVRLWNLAKKIAENHHLTLVAFTHDVVSDSVLEQAGRVFRDICPVLMPEIAPTRNERIRGWFSARPCSVATFDSEEMRQATRWCSDGADFDLAIAWELGSAPFVESLRRMPRFLEGIEASVAMPLWSSNPRVLLRRWKYRNYLRELAREFDGFGTVSEDETDLLKRVLGPAAPLIGTFANGVDVGNLPYQAPAGGHDLIYYGSLGYHANRDAVDYFCREVLPLIREKEPRARLVVTGRVEEAWKPASARGPEIVYTGFLDDPRPAMMGSAVSVAPLRIGGGTRLKVLEAMALGTPVAGTSIGLEGLNLERGREALVADDPAALSEAVLSLLQDRELALRISRAARERVEREYDWSHIAEDLERFLNRVVSRERAVGAAVLKERAAS